MDPARRDQPPVETPPWEDEVKKMTVSKKIAAATAGVGLLGAGVLGVSGVAGATTSTTHHPKLAAHAARVAAFEAKVHEIATSGKLPARFTCSNSSTVEAKITKLENRIDQRLPIATLREQNATANGNTARATAIAHRIASADQLKTDLTTISGLITAQCGA